jgi:hypothetical protein
VSDALPPGASITELVIVPALPDDEGWLEGDPAGSQPVQLLPDLTLRRLSRDQVREYVRACNPAHPHFKPYEDDGHRYAFVRHPVQTTLNRLHAFDEDDVLHSALALSRYFALNSHCTQYAARRIEGVYDNKPLEIKQVQPAAVGLRRHGVDVLPGSRSRGRRCSAKPSVAAARQRVARRCSLICIALGRRQSRTAHPGCATGMPG